MENQPHIPVPELNAQELPESVNQVAKAIYRALADDLGLEYTAKTLTGHSVLFLIDEEDPLSLTNFNALVNEYSAPTVNIQFNQDEQSILVSPMRN